MRGIHSAMTGLALVPLVDRFGSSSLRRRKMLLIAGGVVVFTLITLAIYAAIAPPVEHIPDKMKG